MEEFRLTHLIERTLKSAQRALLKIQDNPIRVGVNRFGDVTYNIDLESEHVIFEEFEKTGEGFTIISEESGIKEINGGGMTVVVDPLDGSNNAVKEIPFYSISIAISKGDLISDILASGIINVINGDIICSDSHSVFFNGEARHPSNVTELSSAISTIIPRLFYLNNKEYEERLVKMFKQTKHPRFLGSAAMESAYVSVGLIDAFIELYPRLRVVDIAASLHMARTSGAYVNLLNIEGELNLKYDGRISCLIAANNILGHSYTELLK
ncbi:MAG: inositol monophosphatase family protein [Nitrososphaeria archaeon]|jgi:fructose-1,6-bisphosphatase/inositol monophosphatase family enzyme